MERRHTKQNKGLFCFSHDSTENREKEDKPKEKETKEAVAEEKPKARSSRQKDEAPAFTSSVFALLDVYLTKMLVRPLVSFPNILMFDYGPRFVARPV